MAIVSTEVLLEQGGPTIDPALAGAYHQVSNIHNRVFVRYGDGVRRMYRDSGARAVNEQYNSSSKTRQVYIYEIKD
jgi:hypothetical protein